VLKLGVFDGALPGVELVHLGGHNVDGHHLVVLGQQHGVGQTDVAGAGDGNFHRRDQAEIRPQFPAQGGGFQGGTDHAIQARFGGETGQAQDLLLGAGIDADGAQFLRPHAGQYRHGDQQRTPFQSLQRFPGGGEHARSTRSMHVHHPHPEPSRRPAGLGHGMGDVVELQVEEHRIAQGHQFAHEIGAGGHEQFLAHLEPAEFRTQAGDDAAGRFRIRVIQGDDDARAEAGLSHAPTFPGECSPSARRPGIARNTGAL
jgi:hypothetical protein